MTIEFPSGGFLGVYTADNPVGILGESFDLVVCDEAARFAPEVWTETLWPTLADRSGRAILISTPRGLNWFYTEWLRGQDPDQPEYASWQLPSADNPSPAIREAARLAVERVPEQVYRQEWLAEFLSSEGVVFRNVDALATLAPAEPAPDRRYVVGVDLARTTDWTVVTVLDVTDRPARQVHLDRWQGVDWRIQLDRIRAVVERYHPMQTIVDRTGIGDMPYQELAHTGHTRWHGVHFDNATKAEMVQGLALVLERRDLALLANAVQSGELKAYEAKATRTGLVTYSAPDGAHDDTVSALMLAASVMAHQRARLVA